MKIGLLFPGYGSQYVGMAKELYDESRLVQEYFEQAAQCLDVNFVKLCFASSDAELGKVTNAYTSLFLVSSAIVALLKEEGLEPSVVAGYGVGLHSAVFAGGGVSFPDGLYLLNKLAGFYQEFMDSHTIRMIRVTGVSRDVLDNTCLMCSDEQEMARVAVSIHEHEHLVGGTATAIGCVEDELLKNDGIKIKEDHVEVGLHSSMMTPVFDALKMYFEKVDFKDVVPPVISGLNGAVLHQGPKIKDEVIAQIQTPIVWYTAVDALGDCDVLIEVGPGKKLSQWLQGTGKTKGKKVFQVNTPDDLKTIKELVKEMKPAEAEGHEPDDSTEK